ncbi:MAG TPA: hypothetical protein VF049_00145 [Nocardioidaceae bacterium]
MTTVPQSDPQRNRRDQLRRLEFIASPAGQEFTAAVATRSSVVHCTHAHFRHVVAAAQFAGAGPAETRRALDQAYHALVRILDSALIEAVEDIRDGNQ